MALLTRDPSTGAYSFADPANTVINQVTGQKADTLSPAVMTSKAASDNYANIKSQYQDVANGMANQGAVARANEAAKSAAMADKTAADEKARIEKQKADAATAAANAKSAAVGGPSLNPDADRSELDRVNAEYQAEAKRVQDTISNIQSGVTPLAPWEQAAVDNLKSQFQTLISAQEAQNVVSSNVANVRGFQKGAAEYDANFQVKTIGAIVSAGQAKVAELNGKMANAVATLTQSFKDNDIKAVRDAWAMYQDTAKERKDELQKTFDATQAAINKANEKIIQASRDSAIGGLIEQGVTDPAKLLDLVNFDEDGNQVGDFTADEVSNALTKLYKNTKVGEGALGLTKDETIKLYGSGFNADEIQMLEKYVSENGYDDQLIAQLTPKQKEVLDNIFLPKKPTSGVGDKLTLSEAKSLGLPVSLIGRSQEQIISDLQNSTPPKWFVDYNEMNKEHESLKVGEIDVPMRKGGQNLLPEVTKADWDEFRNGIMNSFTGGGGGSDFSSLPAPIE